MSTQGIQRAVRTGTALAALLLTTCATNPVSGKSELALVSEAQEIEMGKQGAAEVAQTIGLYPDAAVQAYVSRLGLTLAARTQRPGLPWQYQVVDDPAVNAFALPGGFIFVTRGLLTSITNEAERPPSWTRKRSRRGAAPVQQDQPHRSGAARAGPSAQSSRPTSPNTATRRGGRAERPFLKFSRDDETQADQTRLRLRPGRRPVTCGRWSMSSSAGQPGKAGRRRSSAQWRSTIGPGGRIAAAEPAWLQKVDLAP
jgi:predicted Zn-dependent protease